MAMPDRSRGMLITLEGPDGAGKSTQARRLAAGLQERGYRVRSVREPGGTQIGEAIRNLLLDPAAPPRDPRVDVLLFNAARAQLVGEVIAPALAAGEIVVCDRYVDSTLAYQGYGEGLPLDELRRVSEWSTGGLYPDLTILLDASAEIGLARRRQGDPVQRNRFESGTRHDLAFHQRVRVGFLEMAADDKSRWRVVQADEDAQLVAGLVLVHALDALSHAVREPQTLGSRIHR